MANSDFWRHLAVDFQAIPDFSGMLRADGYYIVGSGEPWNWQLKGVTTSDFIYSAFETLARRGAAEIVISAVV